MHPSSLLVTAQFGLVLLMLLWVEPRGNLLLNVLAFSCVVLGVFTGTAALAVNRLGNFSIRPEPKRDTQLVTAGIYRRIRHPMYTALALVMLGPVLIGPGVIMLSLWIALCVVLHKKALREEGFLLARFPAYGEYMQHSKRFLPFVI